MSEVWMVRHAPVVVSGVCYGQLDVATEVDDEEAADVIGRAFGQEREPRWDEIWSSPWARTERVAEAFASRRGVSLRRDARLSELSFGEWEGSAYADLEAKDEVRFSAWMRDYDGVAPPGGETADALVERVRSFLLDVERSGRTVLAIAHAGTIRAARAARAGVRFSRVAHTPVAFLVPERV